MTLDVVNKQLIHIRHSVGRTRLQVELDQCAREQGYWSALIEKARCPLAISRTDFRAAQRARGLDWKFRLGTAVTKAQRPGPGRNFARELARDRGVCGDDVHKARAFANLVSRAELRELVKPKGFTICWSHVRLVNALPC